MTGRLAIVGIGPGAAGHVTPLATETLAIATDLVGYGPYLSRVPERRRTTRHASDNREELARAREALALAARASTLRWSPPAIPACSPWRAQCSRRSRRAGGLEEH